MAYTENLTNSLKGLENIKKLYNEPMSRHTTFKVGGEAELMLLPSSASDVVSCVTVLKSAQIPYIIIGKGSNLLVGDKGIKGAVVKLSSDFSGISVTGETVTAEAGASLSSVASLCLKNSLTGFEFAAGIPGNVGGGVCMNAGAYGGELKDVITSVTVLKDGKVLTLKGADCAFGYRTSRIMKENMIVLSAEFKLEKGDPNEISEKMKELSRRRNEKQPLEYPSAGSTFKRPEGYFAGKLIEDAGLKGCSIGGAQVSEKHCGFVINKGGATAKDITDLISYIQKTVFDKFGVKLETEVRLVGEFV